MAANFKCYTLRFIHHYLRVMIVPCLWSYACGWVKKDSRLRISHLVIAITVIHSYRYCLLKHLLATWESRNLTYWSESGARMMMFYKPSQSLLPWKMEWRENETITVVVFRKKHPDKNYCPQRYYMSTSSLYYFRPRVLCVVFNGGQKRGLLILQNTGTRCPCTRIPWKMIFNFL